MKDDFLDVLLQVASLSTDDLEIALGTRGANCGEDFGEHRGERCPQGKSKFKTTNELS